MEQGEDVQTRRAGRDDRLRVAALVVFLAGFLVPRVVLPDAPDGFAPGTQPTAEERAWLGLAASYEDGLSDLLITGYSADVGYCADGQEVPALAGNATVRTWWFLPLHRRGYHC